MSIFPAAILRFINFIYKFVSDSQLCSQLKRTNLVVPIVLETWDILRIAKMVVIALPLKIETYDKNQTPLNTCTSYFVESRFGPNDKRSHW